MIGYVEPKPGIPPTPQHTLDVIQAMRAQQVKLIIVEPYFDLKTPNSIASQTGAKVWSCRRRSGAFRRPTS